MLSSGWFIRALWPTGTAKCFISVRESGTIRFLFLYPLLHLFTSFSSSSKLKVSWPHLTLAMPSGGQHLLLGQIGGSGEGVCVCVCVCIMREREEGH